MDKQNKCDFPKKPIVDILNIGPGGAIGPLYEQLSVTGISFELPERCHPTFRSFAYRVVAECRLVAR
jgi:hypothetical protein